MKSINKQYAGQAGLAAVVAALAVMFALVLAGCSGGTSDAGQSTNGSTVETEMQEEAGLAESDVVGYWNLTSSGDSSMTDLNEAGLYVLYRFDEGGSITMIALAAGSNIERTGTWEIDGDTVVVNVPAGDTVSTGASSGLTSLTANAIENAVITFNNGVLTSEDIGDGTVKAQKITDARYETIVAAAEEAGPQSVAIGEQVTSNALTFTVNSMEWRDTILPSDTSGYYTYIDDQSGSTYLCAFVTATNNGTEYGVLHYSTEAVFNLDGNSYSASVERDAGTLFGKSYSLEAKETGNYVIYAAIPDSVRNASSVSLSWTIPDSPSYLNTFFNSSVESTTYVISM